MTTAGADLPPLLRPKATHRPLWKRLLLAGLAILCFVLGIVGWLVPVVTGIPFYLASIVLAAMVSDQARAMVDRWDARLSDRNRHRVRRVLRKIPVLRRILLEPATADRAEPANREPGTGNG